MTRLTLDKGSIALPVGVARELAASELALASWSRRHLLAGDGDILLAGRLGDIAVADLLSFVNMFRKSGVLHFSLPGGEKELIFVDGEIVHAFSTFPEEDLGEFLLTSGLVDRDLLVKVRQKGAIGGDGLRRQLLEGGYVAPRELWSVALTQVETIVYNLIPAERGDYVLFRGGENATSAELPQFGLSTQNLIMEGLRRGDERLLFMRTLHSLDALPIPSGAPPEVLPPAEERMLALVQAGRSTVREVVAKSGQGEIDGLRILYHLVERELIRIEPPPSLPTAPEVVELLAIFNATLTELYRPISAVYHGYLPELRRFLRDLPPPYNHVFRHAPLAEDGTVDAERIAANLAGLEASERSRLLCEAMNELLFAACLIARRDLGEHVAAPLVQRVQEIGRRAKTVSERKSG